MSPVVSRGLAQISLEDPEHMRTLAEQAAEELADAPAEEVIRWAVDTFGDRICVTSSMTDAVIIHLASSVHPGIDVVFSRHRLSLPGDGRNQGRRRGRLPYST